MCDGRSHKGNNGSWHFTGISTLRITLIIYSLDAGGAQRVAANMANHWSKAGHAFEFLTFLPDGSRPFYPLDPTIRFRTLGIAWSSPGLMTGVINNLRRVF